MNIKVCNKDIVVGVVAAIIGATISSTMAPADSYGYITVNPDYRPSTRTEEGSVMRDTDAELQEQSRRNARLRAAQEQEALHGAATDEDELLVRDARAHFRAYRHCTFRGYTRSRLHECVEQVLAGGEYNLQY